MRFSSSPHGQTMAGRPGEVRVLDAVPSCLLCLPPPDLVPKAQEKPVSFPGRKVEGAHCAILSNCAQFWAGLDAQKLLLAPAGKTPGSWQGSVPTTQGVSQHLEERVFTRGDPETKKKQTPLTSSAREKDASAKSNL